MHPRLRQPAMPPDAPTLLSEVRNYLDITWPDAEGDAKLTGIIERGKRYLNSVAGAELNYDEPNDAQGLLFNYCRYERSNALHEFQRDYQHELVALYLDGGEGEAL